MIKNVIINLKNLTKYPIPEGKLVEIAQSILRQTDLRGIVEIDLTICNESYIQKLNLTYRNIDKPTDVLSFPIANLYRGKPKKSFIPVASDQPLHLGDIILCYPYIERQANEQNKSIEDEFLHLFRHGIKHLIGFHHK